MSALQDRIRRYAKAHPDVSRAEVARRLGIASSTVTHALMDPDEYRAQLRRDNAKRAAAKLAHERANRPLCACGAAMWHGHEMCRPCWVKANRARTAPRRDDIIARWNAGESSESIGADHGLSGSKIAVLAAGWRHRGYDVAHRRTPEQIERIVQNGRWGRRVAS